jgi:RimJ/RimL family protein N-acetyltransferase
MTNLTSYLEPSAVIDWQHEAIRALAEELRSRSSDELSLVRRTFEWVRDNVRHSGDFPSEEVTCRASDVLLHRTGYCYAKSHLLAALLRANGVPTGFCYQRLSTGGDGPPYCLHGLNAVCLRGIGWLRLDARGNKAGVTCSFNPPAESVPFRPSAAGEAEFPEIWATPLARVVGSLAGASSVEALAKNLPDVTEPEMLSFRSNSGTPPILLWGGAASNIGDGGRPAAIRGRVRLRQFEQHDLPRMYEMQLDPESNRLAATIPRTAEAFEAHWANVLRDPSVTAKAILLGDEMVGNVSCFQRDGQANVGYWVSREHWGEGIASRALELLLLEVAARPLYAHVAIGNGASLRVLQKCGFVVEPGAGVARQRPLPGV